MVNKIDLIMYAGVFILVASLLYHPLLYVGLSLQLLAIILQLFAKRGKHEA